MERYYCFGKKDFCGNSSKCVWCEFCNGKGGMYITNDSEDYQAVKRIVAKEIFEDIEKVIASVYNDFMFNREYVGMNETSVVMFSDELDIAIADLKKKYTEGAHQ